MDYTGGLKDSYSRGFIIRSERVSGTAVHGNGPKSLFAVVSRESQLTGHDRSVFRDVLVTRNACTRLGPASISNMNTPFLNIDKRASNDFSQFSVLFSD